MTGAAHSLYIPLEAFQTDTPWVITVKLSYSSGYFRVKFPLFLQVHTALWHKPRVWLNSCVEKLESTVRQQWPLISRVMAVASAFLWVTIHDLSMLPEMRDLQNIVNELPETCGQSFITLRAQYNYLWLSVFLWFILGYGDLGTVSIEDFPFFPGWYFRYKNKTVVSYFYNGSSYTGKTTYLYWDSPLQPSINEYATAKNYRIGKWCNCTIVFLLS